MNTWGTIALNRISLVLRLVLILALYFGIVLFTDAATIHNYRDTISNSAPDEYSNHTVEFKTTVALPPGGYVRWRPSPGDFTIPAVNFDIDNVELFIATSSGYNPRSLASLPDATNDGVSITTGISGNIEVTLSSGEGIPAGADIRLKIGTHTTNTSTSTDVGILNPSATTSYPFFIETGGNEDDSVRGWIALVNKVSVPNIDTRETVPPFRFNGAPSGELSGTVVTVQMSLETDEFSRCRYSTASNTPYFSIGNEFDQSTFATIHSVNVNVATNTSYSFFVRCIDDEGNFNTDDYEISFSIPEYPEGIPGNEGDDEGEGSGTGEGDGTADPGDGSSSGGEDADDDAEGEGSGGSGGGSGGGSSGGGGDDGGGFEGSERPYQSGDGRVIVNGFAFPNSDIVILVDGAIAEEDTAASDGDFSVTIDEIARGVYTFGVYAIDRNGTRSSTFSTTFSVTGSRGSTLSNINVMPSIVVEPDPVDPGAMVNFSGYSIPDSTVTIENQNDKTSASLKTFTTTADGSGAWSLDVSTTGFQTGTYKVRAKSKQDAGVSTDFSGFTYYGVGEQALAPQTSDLNRDGSVNLIDFSILLFWWNSDGGASDPPADINRDGNVSLTDFSIMIFNWTG